MLNDFFTAGNGVLMKQKLESKDLGKYGLMFYNSLFMLGPATVFAWQTGDIEEVLGECHNGEQMEKRKKYLLIPLQSMMVGVTAGSQSSSPCLVCSGSF